MIPPDPDTRHTEPASLAPQPIRWLAEQQGCGRQTVLIIDTQFAPDIIATLFTLAPIRDYRRLFQGTEFDNLLEQSPWLIRIDPTTLPAVERLLARPETNWGWFASASPLDLDELVRHWRDRMVIREGEQRWLYRFQDNRVISRHLKALDTQQIPLLLGPLAEALCWDGTGWQRFENRRPALYLPPFAMPWTEVLESAAASEAIELRALENWLWHHHPQATARLPIGGPLSVWLKSQLALAGEWGWDQAERIHFLVEHKLDPALAQHDLWDTKPNETPAAHFQRVQRDIAALLVVRVGL